MKKCLITIFAFSIMTAFGSPYQSFAHGTVDFNGTIEIVVGDEIIKDDVGGQVAVAQWGHGETNGNFDEAIFNFEFGTETTECGNTLEEITVRVSSYRENKYSLVSKKFPLDLSEDGMAEIIERILNKYGETVQNVLGLDECFSLTDGKGTIENGKLLRFANAYIAGCKVVIGEHSDTITFKVKKAMLKTYDADFQNKKEFPLKISGELEIPLPHESNSH